MLRWYKHRSMFRRLLLATSLLAWTVAGPGAPLATAQVAGPPVTLRDALAQARAQSPARQASAARVEAADLSRTFAGRLLNPVSEFRWENLAPGLRDTLPLDVFATVSQRPLPSAVSTCVPRCASCA